MFLSSFAQHNVEYFFSSQNLFHCIIFSLSLNTLYLQRKLFFNMDVLLLPTLNRYTKNCQFCLRIKTCSTQILIKYKSQDVKCSDVLKI